jgi:DNA-binding NtrC family response regulator
MYFENSMHQYEKIASVKMDKSNTKKRILLVVSNDLIRDIFRKLFLRLGYHIIAVDTARSGFKAFNEVCFDIVICDFDLRDITGLEFYIAIKNICPERTNVLMITPGDLVNVSEIKKRNIRHIMEKPFSFEELLKIVNNSRLKN